MGIEINYKNKGLFKKKLTFSKLSDILNNEFEFGIMNSAYVNDSYNKMENINNKTFIVNKKNETIGRGFWFTISNNQSDFYVSLNTPTTTNDILNMYNFIKKTTEYLNIDSIMQDNEIIKISDITDDFINSIVLSNFSNIKKSLEIDYFITFGAKNPIWIEEDIQNMLKGLSDKELEEKFSSYLNSKQIHNYYYMKPNFFNPPKDNNTIIGVYALTEGVDSIIPKSPYITFNCGLSRDTPINEWIINFVSFKYDEKGKIINSDIAGSMNYYDFLKKLDNNQISNFDANHYIIKGFSQDDLQKFLS